MCYHIHMLKRLLYGDPCVQVSLKDPLFAVVKIIFSLGGCLMQSLAVIGVGGPGLS